MMYIINIMYICTLKRKSLFILFLCLLLLIFNSCENPIMVKLLEPLAPSQQQLSPGKGAFSLSIDGAKTILPDTTIDSLQVYTLEFTGTETLSIDRTNANLSTPINLQAGTYSLIVTAYMDTAKAKPAAVGSLTGIVITAGQITNRTIPLTALGMTAGKGVFSWNIDFPDGLSEVKMNITPVDGSTGTPEQTLYFIGGSSQVNRIGSVDLNSGMYRIAFTLIKNENTQTVIWQDVVHVYQNMTSVFNYTFTEEHFNKYTVTFNKNNTDLDSTEANPQTKTVTFPATTIDALPTEPMWTSYTFVSWNTQADGSGTTYVQTTTVSSNITVYAQWKNGFPSVAALKEWLDTKGTNTVDDPYVIALNIGQNDITNLKTTLKNSADKYVDIDLSGSTITSIGVNAFNGCTSLISVTIPDSVTSIGAGAFSNCTGLTSVTIGNGVTNIGNEAFRSCISLASVTIPNSVTSIGDYAFQGCKSLTSVTIPDSVTSIESSAFSGCTSLASVTIPNSVTIIEKDTFRDCISLTSVTIPNSVTNIEGGAFIRCTSLDSVTIPDSVTSIGRDAFYYCTNLTSLTIPDSVTSIGDSAFGYCNSLTSVTIPNSVTSIESSAFSGCTSLASVTIPDSVTSIGRYAFYYCTNLTSVTIPDSVTSIGDSAFGYCNSLASVTIPDSVTSIGDSAFGYCNSLASVTIGNGVTSIGDRAFYNCASLASVTIGNGVTSIGDRAFSGCASLTSVKFEGTISAENFDSYNFPGDLRNKYLAVGGGIGTYTSTNGATWVKNGG
jgi:hypothetical protein